MGFEKQCHLGCLGCLFAAWPTLSLRRISARRGAIAVAAQAFTTVCLAVLLGGCASEYHPTNAEYRQQYNKPLASPGSQFAALPPAVQNTVRAEAGSAEISEVIKDSSSGRIFYRIYFQNGDLLPPLYVAPDGTLLDPDLMVAIGAPQDTTSIVTGGPVAGLTLSDLPPAVLKSIQRRVPDAQVDSITRQGSGDQTTYVITFKDRLHPALYLGSDGSLVAEPLR